MGTLNHVQVIGYLWRDPEVRYLPDGMAVATVSVATSEQWTEKGSGEKKERTEWHRVVTWGKVAEICGQYLKKGSQVYFQGKLQTQKWTDKGGVDRYTTEIRADRMVMLGAASGARNEPEPEGSRTRPTTTTAPQRASAPASGRAQMEMEDDIPF